eukprot:TCONS_00051025-protein
MADNTELRILTLIFFPTVVLCGQCFIPDFKSEGDINLMQALEPCCFGSSKCNTSENQFHFGKNLRLSEIKPDVMLSCVTPGVFHCTRCPGGLFFSEKCNACMEYLKDEQNICPDVKPPATPTDTPDPSFDKDFCKQPPLNGQHMGNKADPKNRHYYYACVNRYTYHMPCPKGLTYNEHVDACRR